HPGRALWPDDGRLHRRRRRGGSDATGRARRRSGGGLMFGNVDWADIGKATIDTLLMLGGSMVLTVILGVPLGVLLYLSGKGRLAANPVLNAVLSFVVNVLRSVPFIILLIVMLPVTVLLVGTSLGVAGAIPPLVVGAAPFYARLVETALCEVDKG